MNMPGFTAEAALPDGGYGYATAWSDAGGAGSDEVVPQACACTPCVQIGGGRWCVTIPVINRRVCVNVPSAGRWRVCGCVRFGWPPFSASLRRC